VRAFLWALIICQVIALTSVVTLPLPPITQEQIAAAERASQEEAAEYTPLRRFWHWTTHDAVAFYTSVLAIFTGVLGISTIGLWSETRRAGERQSADMKTSIEVATRSAEAARLSADASIAAERARIQVIITRDTCDDIFKAAIQYPNSPTMTINRPGMGVIYDVVNLGRTPAIIRSIKHGMASSPVPPDPEYVERPGDEGVVLANDARIKDVLCFGDIKVTTIADALLYLYGERYFWFFVDILYEDIFDIVHHKRMFSRFAFGRGGRAGEWLPVDYKDYNKST
jgi:hypothetical protein